jgi:UDP-N-acetylglucosamine 2-epimerase (non-hydrolysing)
VAIIAPLMSAARTVLSVVGTRPNFMKTAPVVAALESRAGFRSVLVHTGQHYDEQMSRVFLEELGVGEPDHMLGVGSASHALQAARVMERLEPVLESEQPDVVLVPGDVNSTLAAALTAAKMEIPVGHVEAGLRSFDRTMPEELNRVVADQVSEFLFTHSPEALDNLVREGQSEARVHMVGNTMIDTLAAMRGSIDALDAPARHGLDAGSYVVVTLHRPALVDGPLLADAMESLAELAGELPVVFPAHPRTRARLEALSIKPGTGVRLTEPLGYLEFLSLLAGAGAAITDSGGIQEETTFLGVPCFTLRSNTERPVTCDLGTNTLLGLDPARITEVPRLIEEQARRPATVPPLWDGHAAPRIVDVLAAADLELIRAGRAHWSGQPAASEPARA